MKMAKNFKSILSAVVCFVLIAAMALMMTACSDKIDDVSSAPVSTDSQTTDTVKEVGEGKTEFDFTVTDGDGNQTKFKVKTDETMVGAALQKVGLIEGDDGEFGLYVKKVNGIVADYNVDQTYWAFYINGNYAISGVDKTEIKANESYAFKIEK